MWVPEAQYSSSPWRLRMYMAMATTSPMIPRRMRNFFTVPPSVVSEMMPEESMDQTPAAEKGAIPGAWA